MCGIAGIWQENGLGEEWRAEIRAMTDAIARRGPDGSGDWADLAAGVTFGHRRLAIVDVSEEGRQPRLSRSKRFAVTFNGEIYNFQRLRQQLQAEGVAFSTNTDTEVLVEAIQHWGVAAAVAQFVGMFAFAAFDRRERRLWLVRDRLGKKPLYFGFSGSRIAFASELRAMAATSFWSEPNIDRAALDDYLRRGYVRAPRSIFSGIEKIGAGEIISLGEADLARGLYQRKRYWSPSDAFLGSVRQETVDTSDAILERANELIEDAVRLRMIADVPLGAFLSGGIDSSLVVATMQALSPQPVRTFSIGFQDRRFDESGFAREVARILGTQHTELVLDAGAALEAVPRLSSIYDEPIADPSAIPTTLLCELTQQHVKVALSGDGGDEVFGGYDRYAWFESLMRLRSVLRQGGRALCSRALKRLATPRHGQMRNIDSRLTRSGVLRERMERVGRVLSADGAESAYAELVAFDADAVDVACAATASDQVLHGAGSLNAIGVRRLAQMMDLDAYLPDNLMVKVDRASMFVGLEARAPLMDHRLVDFMGSLSPRWLSGRFPPKWVLRRLLARHIPQALIDRPKRGFAVPLDEWLTGPLREWSEDLLSPSTIERVGLLSKERVSQIWSDHKSGRRRASYVIWNLLVLQSWRLSWQSSSRKSESIPLVV